MTFLIFTNVNGPNLLYRKQENRKEPELMKKPLTRRSFLQGAGMASAATRAVPVFGSPLRYTQTGLSPPDRPFLLSATVAFPDDCSEVIFTKSLLGAPPGTHEVDGGAAYLLGVLRGHDQGILGDRHPASGLKAE